MDHITAQAEGRINGVRSVVLENDFLRASILPEIGGKIYGLTWKPSDWNILWKNPRVAPQPYPVEAAMGDFWCGGWDDIFPTCDACEFEGLRYPALGEVHQSRFSVDEVLVDQGEAIARMSAFTPISPVQVRKTVTLAGPVLRIRNEITNLGPARVDFVWGTHPAFNPTSQMTLKIPARTGIVAHSSGPGFGTVGQQYPWPKLITPTGEITEMNRVYGRDSKGFCGHYVTELQEGWYAIEDEETGQGVVVSFPLDICPFIWMWLGYGGWRGHWVVIIEPYTSYPVCLSDAVRQRTHRSIEENQTFCVDIAATCYRRPETLADALIRLQ